ncbi:MAG UNVERIFIED_CONTAM: hypothetical protein LVQ98_06770 [Rickettsiaceae bacterium]|jgi:hypothetical protein
MYIDSALSVLGMLIQAMKSQAISCNVEVGAIIANFLGNFLSNPEEAVLNKFLSNPVATDLFALLGVDENAEALRAIINHALKVGGRQGSISHYTLMMDRLSNH